MSFEGIVLEHFSALPYTEKKLIHKTMSASCSVSVFFSDDSKQDAATTTEYSNSLIELKIKKADVSIEYNMGKHRWLCRAIYM